MIFELIATAFAVAAGVLGILAWFYKKGKIAGIDSECSKRIEGKLDSIQETVGSNKEESDKEHTSINTRLGRVEVDVGYIKGKVSNLK